MTQVLRFSFNKVEGQATVEADMALAIFAAECMYGKPRVRMETSYLVSESGKECALKIGGEAGEAAARIFAGLQAARIGEEGFIVRRVGIKAE